MQTFASKLKHISLNCRKRIYFALHKWNHYYY